MSFEEQFSDELKAIYDQEINEDGRSIFNDGNLPSYVKARCDWAIKYVDAGMTFLGVLQTVLAFDEKRAKEDFLINALEKDWMPVTNEFREWTDHFTNLRQIRVALYLIYGGH